MNRNSMLDCVVARGRARTAPGTKKIAGRLNVEMMVSFVLKAAWQPSSASAESIFRVRVSGLNAARMTPPTKMRTRDVYSGSHMSDATRRDDANGPASSPARTAPTTH